MGDLRTRRGCLSLIASSVTASLAGCSNVADVGDETATPATETRATTPPPANPNASVSGDLPPVYVDLYNQIVGSVVLIRVPNGGLGSGFHYDKTHVVTNYHVVTDADTVEIKYAHGETITGQVLGTDRYSDLAVVRVKQRPNYADPLPLHPDDPKIGRRVATIGSPYGLSESMTNGIVSGVDRVVPSPQGNFTIPNAIQTDAPVNPGNSGGPLVNLDGDVLGVVNSGGGENIAFAISAALVERVVPAILRTGEYNHPFLGLDTIEVTPIVARANDLAKPRGVLVTHIVEGSPAADVLQASTDTKRVAGFEVPVDGDVILSIAGQKITAPKQIRSYLELHASPGQTIQISIVRDGNEQTVSVEVATLERFK